MKSLTLTFSFVILGLLLSLNSFAVLSVESIKTVPEYPTMDAPITIYVNVNNWEALNADQFSAYTGLVTSESDNSHGWTYVKNSDWNDVSLELEQVQDSIYALVIEDPKAFYGLPEGVETYRITFITRGIVDGANQGQTEDIFLEVYGSEPTNVFNLQPLTPTDKEMICVTWNINGVADRNDLIGNTDSLWVHTWLNEVSGPASGSGTWPDNAEKFLCERVNDSILRWFVAPSVRDFYDFQPWTYAESIGVLIRNKEGNAQTNDFKIPLQSQRDVDISKVNPVLVYPEYPTIDEEIAIYINTNNWNFNTETGFISAYTGLITSNSPDVIDGWQHVINTDWNDVSFSLEPVNDSISVFIINDIQNMYNVDNKNESVFRVTFIARETSKTDSSIVAQTENLYFEIYGDTPTKLVQTQPAEPSEDDAIAYTFNINSQTDLASFVAENGKDSIYVYTWLNTDEGEGYAPAEWGAVSENSSLKTIAVNDSIYRFYAPFSVRKYYNIEDSCLHVLSTNLILRNAAGTKQTENIIVAVSQNDVECDDTAVLKWNKQAMKIYPNPAQDFIYIDLKGLNMEQAQVEIYNLSGKKVLSALTNSTSESCINISELKAGVYMVKAKTSDQLFNSTIIIQ